MTFDISLVQWPADPDAAARLLVSCILSAVEPLDVELGAESGDVLELARRYVRGEADAAEVQRVRTSLWGYIRSRDGVANFQDRDLLLARLALCVLPPVATDAPTLEEGLEFLLEVLRRLKLPTKDAMASIIEQLTPYLRKQ